VGCWLGSDELSDRLVQVERARAGQRLPVPVAQGGFQVGVELTVEFGVSTPPANRNDGKREVSASRLVIRRMRHNYR